MCVCGGGGCDENTQTFFVKSGLIHSTSKGISVVPTSSSLPLPLLHSPSLLSLFVHFLLSHSPFLLSLPFMFNKLYPFEA